MCQMTFDFLLPLGQKLNPLVTYCMYNAYFAAGVSQGSLPVCRFSPSSVEGDYEIPQAPET